MAVITFSGGQTLTAPGNAGEVVSTINDTDSTGIFTPLMINDEVVFVNHRQITTVSEEKPPRSRKPHFA